MTVLPFNVDRHIALCTLRRHIADKRWKLAYEAAASLDPAPLPDQPITKTKPAPAPTDAA